MGPCWWASPAVQNHLFTHCGRPYRWICKFCNSLVSTEMFSVNPLGYRKTDTCSTCNTLCMLYGYFGHCCQCWEATVYMEQVFFSLTKLQNVYGLMNQLVCKMLNMSHINQKILSRTCFLTFSSNIVLQWIAIYYFILYSLWSQCGNIQNKHKPAFYKLKRFVRV